MHSLSAAVAEVLAAIAPLPGERVPLREAHGRVLSTDVRSPLDLPPWDNAGMDGYAARAADVRGASAEHPVELAVVETIAAGAAPERAVGAGEAARIMTGAPVPAGADSVVRVEDTDEGETRVAIRGARDAGRNVRPRGEDVRAGEVALPAGTYLGGAQLAMLAAVGATEPQVRRRPRVALLSSGDELVPVERFPEVLAGRRIVATNEYALAALVHEAGGVPVDLGLAPDDPVALRERVEAARGCDLLVTTAGASVGAHDYTRRVLEEAGATLRFWRVRIRPGSQLAFGMLGEMPWLGLPGNPASALVTFELFVRPALRRALGLAHPFRRAEPVRLAQAVRTAGGSTHLLRAVLREERDGSRRAHLSGPQGSGMVRSMALADALLVIPPDTPELPEDATVASLPLGPAGAYTAVFPFPAL
jgi:molybdopterin molybdotransferase